VSLRIWDVSQTLRPGLPVWPGDTAFGFERSWRMEDGSPVNVGRMTMSTHSGTHGDAPLHYAADAPDIASVDLDPYLGECLVVDARSARGAVEVGDLPTLGAAERVLLRTFKGFPHERWDSAFTAIAPETIRWLAAQGVRLIGTDAPSLDPQESKTMEAHKAVLAADMRILEGLVLDDVPPGRYELIALPLKIAGGDAGLCRAILRELPRA
jgi:arylformamidase